MRKYFGVIPLLIVFLVCMSGCEGDGSSSFDGTGSVPDLAGTWTGTYYIEEDDTGTRFNSQSISATVTQSGISVSIVTSKGGTAHELVGEIDASGNMLMTDSFDGETWSTFNRAATESLIELNDILREDEITSVDYGDSLATVVLRR